MRGWAVLRVRDLDEATLLGLFVPHLPRGRATLLGPGDDAAVVAVPDGRVVVTTDVLVEDQHFRRCWSSGADVGRRAAAQNLSDVAAMGAEPTAAVVALVVPPDLAASWVVDLADGLAAAFAPLGVGVVGGDLSAGERIAVAVTVHGDLGGRAPVLRSGARPGDVVAVAGVLGRSAAGLALLRAAEADRVGDVAAGWPDLLAAYLRPDPPLAAGPAAARAGATAMIDLSDGLLRDAGRIALASDVVVDLDPLDRSLAGDLRELAAAADATGADATRWALTGGEDHGLLATFPPEAPLPAAFRRVGRVVAGHGGPTGTVLVAGGPPPVTGLGWDHFAGS